MAHTRTDLGAYWDSHKFSATCLTSPALNRTSAESQMTTRTGRRQDRMRATTCMLPTHAPAIPPQAPQGHYTGVPFPAHLVVGVPGAHSDSGGQDYTRRDSIHTPAAPVLAEGRCLASLFPFQWCLSRLPTCPWATPLAVLLDGLALDGSLDYITQDYSLKEYSASFCTSPRLLHIPPHMLYWVYTCIELLTEGLAFPHSATDRRTTMDANSRYASTNKTRSPPP